MKLTPYLFFQGTCEEALNTYQKVLGGKVEILQRYDHPAMQAPNNYKDKVAHGRFNFSGIEIMASDVMPGNPHDPKSANTVSLSLSMEDVEKAKTVFNQLGENGTISVPFEKQFWGAWHGNLEDQFGISWMINVDE